MANRIINKISGAPKITEFTTQDLVVDVQNGHLYYKTKKDLFKIQGDIVDTPFVETNITSASIHVGDITASNIAASDIITSPTIHTTNISSSGNISASHALFASMSLGRVDPLASSLAPEYTLDLRSPGSAIRINSDDEHTAIRIGAAGSGNVGLEADGDLTYNPSTGTLTTTKLTATGDVSSSLTSTGSFGKVEAPGEIRGKMLDIKISNFKAALDGTEQLLPLSEGELEATSHTNARVPMVAPYDGRLVKVMMKGSGDTSTHDYVMTFYKYDNGDNTKDTVQQITIAAASMGGSYTANTFEFTAAPISNGIKR